MGSGRSVRGGSQRKAIQTYRPRPSQRGLGRFEVLGRDADRDLIRSLARQFASDEPGATRLRALVAEAVGSEPARTGGVLAALRRSPLVGADLDPSRSRETGRDIDL